MAEDVEHTRMIETVEEALQRLEGSQGASREAAATSCKSAVSKIEKYITGNGGHISTSHWWFAAVEDEAAGERSAATG